MESSNHQAGLQSVGPITAGRGRTFFMILFVAVAYYIGGRLSLTLAIPPGYATAVWPPAGIALAAALLFGKRIWPGIWLGSYLVNVWTQLDASDLETVIHSSLLPATIALGAATQAVAGAWLIRRFVGYSNILEQEFDVVRLLALGGPVACMISSVVGVISLWTSGLIPSDVALFNWWTWWVGDSIGVLIFTPIILIWSIRPFHLWLRQQLAVTLPLLLLFAIVLTAFIETSASEQKGVKTGFEALSNETTRHLQMDLKRYDVILSAIAGLFISSDDVTAIEFDHYAGILLGQLPGLFAVSWNEVVPESRRQVFETQMRAQGFSDFKIVEPNEQGQLVAAAARDQHVVVKYVRYAVAAKSVQGLDFEFDPARHATNQKAAETRRPAATGSIRLLGDIEQGNGLLLNLPVFDRNNHLRGFATLVIRQRNLLEEMRKDLADAGVELQILDRSASLSEQNIYGGNVVAAKGDLSHVVSIDVGQRKWELRYILPASYLIAHRPIGAWLVLAGGMFLIALLGILLLVMVGRAAKIERRVGERTLQLRASEERFRDLVESGPDAVVIVGASGQIELVNSLTEKLFGYSRKELIGQAAAHLIPGQFWSDHASLGDNGTVTPRARAMGEGHALFGRRKDGSEFPLEISLSPLRVGDETIITSAIRDITVRKQAEAELNRALSVLTATLESTTDGILVVDLFGRMVSYNQRFLDLWQIPEELARTQDEKLALSSVLPQLRDPEAFTSKVFELYEDPGAEGFDVVEFKDGKFFERYSTAQLIDGKIVGRVWSFRDVTQRHAVEEALKASEARHRAAEQTQRAIVAGVIDAIVTIDDRGIVQSFNPAAERMFGWSANEMIGSDVRLLMPNQFRDKFDFERLGDAYSIGLRSEGTGLRRDGSEFPIDLALNRMPHPDRREFVAMVADISERKSAEARIHHLAHHDILTKLPNRALLQDRLDMAIATAERKGQVLGVMMIDLDHFKRINDSLGHQAGDQLLLTVADRLRDRVRKADTVARMGGDEFVVLLTDVVDRSDIEQITDAIVRQISLPMTLGTQELILTPSIGVCSYPSDGRDALTLLKNADTAMYRVKENGRGHYQWFSRDMLQAPGEQLALTNALHRALEREEFSLHYQPMVSADNCKVVGVEALLRWTHPTRGPLPPSSFIFLAEESGIIVSIGEWVLRKACSDMQQLQKRIGYPIMLAVNVSPRQFRQQDIVAVTKKALDDSGLAPTSLTLEITESLLLENREDTVATLKRLRQMGVSVAVDDFGTGYSSLSYLTRFPIDKLKIDGSFVRDLHEDSDDAAVISAIIAMGKSLRMTVAAEGVETMDQLKYLRERGCHEIQGFLLSKGVTLEQLSAVIEGIEQKYAGLPLFAVPFPID